MKLRLRNPFYYEKPHTLLHPDYKKLIELAFDLPGFGRLYTFGNLLDMPVERYYKTQAFFTEFHNRLSFTHIAPTLEQLEQHLERGELSKASVLNYALREAIRTGLDITTLYNFCSAVYFTEEEDLQDYDYDYNVKKIEAFRKQKVKDFFLSKPVSDLLNLSSFSESDLQTLFQVGEQKKSLLTTYRSKLKS